MNKLSISAIKFWHIEKLGYHYDSDRSKLYTARLLSSILLGVMIIVMIWLFIKVFSGEAIIDNRTKKVFVPFEIVNLFFMMCSYTMLILGWHRAALVTFSVISAVACITAILITGGFPYSVATPCVMMIPVIVFCLHGKKAGIYATYLIPCLMLLQWAVITKFDIQLPDFTSQVYPAVNIVASIFVAYAIIMFVIYSYDEKYFLIQQELMHANKELNKHEELRKQFFANIGHELRSPITIIRGETEVALMKDEEISDSNRNTLELILDVSNQFERLVDDIFLIAREQAGIINLHHQTVDLAQLLHDLQRQTSSMLSFHGSKLGLDIKVDKAETLGDRDRLIQLINIFVLNAIQHADSSCEMMIKLQDLGEEWQLSIIDNGEGVSVDDAPHIFERYRSGEKKIHLDGQSNTGLGLSIAKSIVNCHHGHIWLDKSYNNGTCFQVTLPKRHL